MLSLRCALGRGVLLELLGRKLSVPVPSDMAPNNGRNQIVLPEFHIHPMHGFCVRATSPQTLCRSTRPSCKGLSTRS